MGVQAVMSSDMSDAGLVPDGKLPPGISSVLAVLLSSAVVLDSEDRVLSSSAAAREFGLVENDRLVVGELVALARQVRREGMPREGEIDIMTSRFNGRATSFAVRVAPLGPAVGDGGLILLLAEDQTESRRVDEVRRDFVANISHELKTPVGALALLAETVEEAADDPEAVLRFAGRMRQEAVPPHRPGAGPDHAVPDSGRRAGPGSEPRGAGRRGRRGRGPVPDAGLARAASPWRSPASAASRSWVTRICWSPPCATSWKTRSPTARTRPGCSSRRAPSPAGWLRSA